MMQEIIVMNGYGAYVWSAFAFTLFGFAILFSITKFQLSKEQKRFYSKFKNLDLAKSEAAKAQVTYKEILTFTSESKI